MLAKAGSSVKLAKVDTTVEKALGKRFKIEGYPTLKFFQYGDDPAPTPHSVFAPAIAPYHIKPLLLNPCDSLSPCSCSWPSLSYLCSCPCSHFFPCSCFFPCSFSFPLLSYLCSCPRSCFCLYSCSCSINLARRKSDGLNGRTL